MSKKTVDFYYWSAACPINIEILELLKEYNDQLDIRTYDVSEKPELAKRMGMFYPTLTVVNGIIRRYSPYGKEFLNRVSEGVVPEERPYLPKLGTEVFVGEVMAVTKENYGTAAGCTGRRDCKGCQEKIRFFEDKGLSVFGFVNLRDGELVGGAEYVPSVYVPYDIPHDEQTAFLSCVYLSDEEFDYKTAPLQELERYLAEKYRKMVVISDEKGVFPNGDMDFFVRKGYRAIDVVFEDRYCRLHLMEKELR